MITNPDAYFRNGCGRCPLFDTPQCKVHRWKEVLAALRSILLETDLTEEAKWGQPCYTDKGKNILLLSALKDYCAISFFKGALLKDPRKVLIQPTKNSNADRSLRFTTPDEVHQQEEIIKEFIHQAIKNEREGLKVPSRSVSDFEMAEEFQKFLDQDPALNAAFEALTPGRQKAYLLHFAQPKQSKTRISRVEKCIPKIMDGIGLNDR